MRTSQVFKSLLVGCFLAAPLFAADQPAAPRSSAHARHARNKKPTPLVLPPLAAGPLRQVPMDQIPASQPKVTYQNGLLSIAAQNSTLGEILNDVRQLTGASIELPPSGASERVVSQLGPGAPREVLAELLNGTAFNYVMIGKTSDPAAVAAVVLTPKSAGGETQTAVNYQPPPPQANQPPMPQPMPFRPGVVQTAPADAAEADDNSDDEDKDEDSDAEQTPQGQPGQGMVMPEGVVGDQQGAPNSGPMTPEQVLERLRQGRPPQPPQGFPPNQQQ